MARNNIFLLDTQIFIQWMVKDRKLGKSRNEILTNPQNTIYLSTVSVWEMVIKKKIGKLNLPVNWKESIRSNIFTILPVMLEHLFILDKLPLYHKDPFDRLLIAQSVHEKAMLISNDKKIFRYNLPILKA